LRQTWPVVPAKPLWKSSASSRAFCIFTAGAPGAYEDIVGKSPAAVTIAPALKAPLDLVHALAQRADLGFHQ
jgi:hypothetical protein